jgi:hypothetical protein
MVIWSPGPRSTVVVNPGHGCCPDHYREDTKVRKASAVRRITVVKAGEGASSPLYNRKRKKGKASKHLRPLERLTGRLISAGADAGQVFEKRYRNSRRKRRNGWLRDMPFNVLKAQRRFGKRLKLRPLCWN